MIKTRLVSTYWATVIAILSAVSIAVAIILIVSENPWSILSAFFRGPFQSSFALGNLLDSASYLAVAGIAVSVAFRAGTFNLGGEGQAYIGSLIGALVCLALPTWGKFASGAAIVAAGVGAGIIAGLSGYMRAKWNVDELITSFLISAAIVPIVDYAVGGPLRDPSGYILGTRAIDASQRFARLLPPSRLSMVAVIAIVFVAVWYVYLYKSFWGYEHRLSGLNASFARYGGIRVDSFMVFSMAASGALFGMTGALYVLGSRYACIQSGTAGLGWNGIAVALIAKNHPLGIIPASLIYAYLDEGSRAAMIQTDFSFELGTLIRAAVFLIITAKRFGFAKKRGQA